MGCMRHVVRVVVFVLYYTDLHLPTIFYVLQILNPCMYITESTYNAAYAYLNVCMSLSYDGMYVTICKVCTKAVADTAVDPAPLISPGLPWSPLVCPALPDPVLPV